jgi:hypothetical protein
MPRKHDPSFPGQWLAPGMAAMNIGRAIATRGAIAGLERAAAGEVVDLMAPSAIKAISSAAGKGTIAGALTGSYGMELGSIYADQAEQGIEKPWKAAAYAVPAAALDAVGELLIMSKLPAFKALQELPFLKTAEGKTWFSRGAKEAFKGGGTEAVTEFAQTLIERGGADKSMLDKEAFEEALNGAIIGGFTGGVFSGAGGAMSRPPTPAVPVTDAPHDLTTGQPVTGEDGTVAGVLGALQNPTESAINVNASPKPQGNILDEILNGPPPVTPVQEVAPQPAVETQPADVPSVQPVTEPSQSTAPANPLTSAAVDQDIVHHETLSDSLINAEADLQAKVASGEVQAEDIKEEIKVIKSRYQAADRLSELRKLQKERQGVSNTPAPSDDSTSIQVPAPPPVEGSGLQGAQDGSVNAPPPDIKQATASDEVSISAPDVTIPELNMQFRTKTAASNSFDILPPVGKKFSDTDKAVIRVWGKANGHDVVTSGLGYRIIANERHPEQPTPPLTEKQAKERDKSDASARARQVAIDKRATDYDASPAKQFIESTFGDAVNGEYNKAALARFLEGADRKFQGLGNWKWKEGFDKHGIVRGDNEMADLRKAYQATAAKASGSNVDTGASETVRDVTPNAKYMEGEQSTSPSVTANGYSG